MDIDGLIKWILGALLALFLFLARIFWNRIFDAHDKLESRVSELEKQSVTHDDLQRLESKLDKINDHIIQLFQDRYPRS